MNYRTTCRTTLAFVLFLALGCGLRAAPIHDAAKAGDAAQVRALLAADPTLVDARDNGGSAPLSDAAQNGHLEVVKLLLDKGATVDAKANEGGTPLLFAAQNGHLEIAKLLLEKGAGVDARRSDGFTPLMAAIDSGSLDVVKLLLEKGALPNVEARGLTALGLAKLQRTKEFAELLQSAGAK